MVIYTWLISLLICLLSTTLAKEWIQTEARFNSYYLNQTTCNFPNTLYPNYVAVGQAHFFNSQSCGGCILAKNPKTLQTVELAIVDLCVGCPGDEIVLDTISFNSIGDTAQGKMSILWKRIPCRTQGNIVFWWTPAPDSKLLRLKLADLAVPIKGVELMVNGRFIPLTKYNRNEYGGIYVEGRTAEIRLTSIFNQTKIEPKLPVKLNQEFRGTTQFDIVEVEGKRKTRHHPILNSML